MNRPGRYPRLRPLRKIMVKKAIKIGRRSKANVNSAVAPERRNKKNGGAKAPPLPICRRFRLVQRSSCSTLCCDWLASDSADVAIDWRVDSAWLLAASSLESASVRADEPVCSTLIRLLLKS